MKQRNTQLVHMGIAWPTSLINEVDQVRGDVPRSKYLQRLAEQDLRQKKLLCARWSAERRTNSNN
jgi:hypothetical protein